MKFFKWLHTIYAGILFVITFLVVFPAFFLLSLKESWHIYAYKLTTAWGWVFFFLAGIKVEVENRNITPWNKPCVYVANHFSYADIASLPLIANDGCFVGKQSITKAPLFGYYFKSLHITVDRESLRDRARVLANSIAVIKKGKSLFIFPEGGIRSNKPPHQVRYKDGAFRAAISTGVPIIPVTLPYNWQVLPDDGSLLLRGNKIKLIIHQAIETTGLTEDDVAELREKVFAIIEKELKIANGKNYGTEKI